MKKSFLFILNNTLIYTLLICIKLFMNLMDRNFFTTNTWISILFNYGKYSKLETEIISSRICLKIIKPII
jgi:hypothetical protein